MVNRIPSPVQWDRIDELFERINVPAQVGLYAEMAEASGSLRIAHLRMLERLGVDRRILAEFNRDFGFGVVKALEHPSDEGLYVPDPGGVPHLLLPVWESGELVDLVVFRSSDPELWLLRTGDGWALGIEHGLDRHTWSSAIPLCVSPLEWLQRGCEGLCVLNWAAPELDYLNGVPHLACSNAHQAVMLRNALRSAPRFPAISVQETHRAA